MVTTRGSTTVVPLSARGARESVEALVKDIYDRAFSHLVQRANVQLAPRVEPQNFIGLLDIFGFEIFEVNSFEQMCINYCNEKLQSLFNYHVFELEKVSGRPRAGDPGQGGRAIRLRGRVQRPPSSS
jgi:myosin heavy subunit